MGCPAATGLPQGSALDGLRPSRSSRLALRASVGLETLPDSRPADADHDIKITAAAARLILRASVKLITLE